jgi:hypothetical protein
MGCSASVNAPPRDKPVSAASHDKASQIDPAIKELEKWPTCFFGLRRNEKRNGMKKIAGL